MSLATRCSACGTVFRVVKDQLLVSDGWVRCGRCNDVFNALEGLFDLERDGLPPLQAPTIAPPKSATVQRVLDELGRHRAPVESATDTAPEPRWTSTPPDGTSALGWPEANILPPAPEPPVQTPVLPGVATAAFLESLHRPSELTTASVQAGAHAPSQADSSAAGQVLDDQASTVVTISAEAAASAAPVGPLSSHQPDPAIVADVRPPQFVREADRAAYWRRPGVRAALASGTVLLVLALGAQVVLHARDLVAARWPITAPWLMAACQPLGCVVQPVARIERLTVDASGLTRVDGTALYRLSLTLKNRADLAVRAPAIELTLTDSAGGLVGRRVLMLADFGLSASLLDAGQELALATTLTTGDRRVSGYTVELFYP